MTTGQQSPAMFAAIPPPPSIDLSASAARFSPLGGVAYPVVQDRWERIVTMAEIPQPPDRVWEALTEPAHVRNWFAVCRGGWAKRDEESTLDFEDGEFFYCLTRRRTPPVGAQPGVLNHLWRWVGVGPAASVTWTVAPSATGTTVTVTEEATNPPSDWRSWNGMGWPGILDQLATYLRTGANTRWPWRRMGPYLQIPLPMMPFEAWELLTSPGAIKHWMQRSAGSLVPDDELTLVMGDASGTVRMRVTKVVDAGQEFPSYLPYLEFELRRPSWTQSLGGRMWIEPTGLGGSLLQIFHFDWERLNVADPVTERTLLTKFWINAAARAQMLCRPGGGPSGPHGWSISDGQPARHGNGQVDMAAAMGFASRVMGDLSGAMTSILGALGVRLGLFAALARKPATSEELAVRTELNERYVREWLWGMTSAGYLRVDHADGRFVLPPEHAGALAMTGSPFCLAGGYELLTPMARMADEVAEAFRTGAGIPQDRYPDSLYRAMEQMSATWLNGTLLDQWLPMVDGLVARLERGGSVADVGCGRGQAVLAMAQRFGNTGFVGYDLHQPNVDHAMRVAEESGVADRVRFANEDAATGLAEHPGPLDLVTMFDVLHDAADPQGLLAVVHKALAPADGVLLVLEGRSADDPEDNDGPAGAILYATSTLYCVPTALAGGGPALGTLGLPYRRLVEMAGNAGFGSVEEIPIHNPFNALYVVRP